MGKSAQTDHDIQASLKTRWSPRAFADRTVPMKTVRSLLEAARWSASCFNEQPWRFMIAHKDTPAQHKKMMDCLMEGNQWAERAPVLILAACKNTFSLDARDNAHSQYDLGTATAQLTMEATARGLFVHQMAGFHPKKAIAAYAIPNDFTPIAVLAVGHLGDPNTLPDDLKEMEERPRERKPLADIAFTDSWGTSL